MNRKEKRAFHHLLIDQTFYHSREELQRAGREMGFLTGSRMERIHKQFDLMGLNEEGRLSYFRSVVLPIMKARQQYYLKPQWVRQDNKDRINTGRRNASMAQGNTIRFPKKCRKTAWKRFYKLFPEVYRHNFI